MKYYINRNEAFTGLKHLEVEYEFPPPCLYCGEPVIDESTDGPLVCPWCDMGYNSDGTKWTDEQNYEKHNHFKKVFLSIKEQNIKDGLVSK